MTKDISQLTDTERRNLFPIILENHNPNWSKYYEEEKENILANVKNIKAIHHYGSTSIPDIMAKPTVDILIEVEPTADLGNIKHSFINLGYNYMAFGKTPSMMFVKGYTSSGFADRVFHIHVYYKGMQRELLFRDYLIAHPSLAKEYERLKLSLKNKYKYDRDGYTQAKSAFIKKITDKAVQAYGKAKA